MEATECQYHGNCGGYCETDEQVANALCEDCMQSEREQEADAAELANLRIEVAALRARLEQPVEQPVEDLAFREAASLAKALFAKHFAHEEHYKSGEVVWSLCDSTAGIISQIDNMVSGLVKPDPVAQPEHPTGGIEQLAAAQVISIGDLEGRVTWLPHHGEPIKVGSNLYTHLQPERVALSDADRTAFEKAARAEGCTSFVRVGDGYADRRTLRCWRIWQAAMRARLEQPVAHPEQPVQQPVAHCKLTKAGSIAFFDGRPMVMVGPAGNECHPHPLYTYPQASQPLSDERLCEAMRKAADELLDHIYEFSTISEGVNPRLLAVGRSIEQAHGIKGGK